MDEELVKNTLNEYFVYKGADNKEAKLRLLTDLVEDSKDSNNNELSLQTSEEKSPGPKVNISKHNESDIDIDHLYVLNDDIEQVHRSLDHDDEGRDTNDVIEIEMGDLADHTSQQL